MREGKIHYNSQRKVKGMVDIDPCLRCGKTSETILHLLWDCEEV